MAPIKLPSQAGAILLGNCITFPNGVLPLHIFEPRYRDMIDDALQSNRMICVANLRDEEVSNVAKCTSKIGYIGIIRVAEKQDNGTSNLILHCISRVKFLSWDENGAYPKAHIKPLLSEVTTSDKNTKMTIESLRDAVSRHLSESPELLVSKTDEILDRFADDIATLTDIIAQQFVEEPNLRILLLENTDPLKRAEMLIRYLRVSKYIL